MKNLLEATEELSNELNKMHSSNHPKGMIELVKRQAEEIDRRGQVIMKMEDSLKLQKENIEKLLLQNKHLEVMIETLRAEREKLLEELKSLKQKPKTIKARKTKSVEKVGDKTTTDAA